MHSPCVSSRRPSARLQRSAVWPELPPCSRITRTLWESSTQPSHEAYVTSGAQGGGAGGDGGDGGGLGGSGWGSCGSPPGPSIEPSGHGFFMEPLSLSTRAKSVGVEGRAAGTVGEDRSGVGERHSSSTSRSRDLGIESCKPASRRASSGKEATSSGTSRACNHPVAGSRGGKVLIGCTPARGFGKRFLATRTHCDPRC